jgi:circadian clock protein KaiB
MTKARKRGRARGAAVKGTTYVFRLFVAGHEPNSAQARENLTRLCEEHLKGRHKIETINVLTDAASAYSEGVLVTPTLILMEPRPRVTLLGNLNDQRRVIDALRLGR